jgi:hypothetical protein
VKKQGKKVGAAFCRQYEEFEVNRDYGLGKIKDYRL